MPRRYANLPGLKSVRRDLRNHPTDAERALWQMLKGRQLEGRKFRRQHSIDRYVVDFFCPSERLAVELDGAVHDDPARREYDRDRQRELEVAGVLVLRFENETVLKTPDVVLAAIAHAFDRSER